MKLIHVIAFTSDIDRMKEFYRDGLGLRVASESPYWVSFESDQGSGELGAPRRASRAAAAKSSCASRAPT